jgi:hypothetical protein
MAAFLRDMDFGLLLERRASASQTLDKHKALCHDGSFVCFLQNGQASDGQPPIKPQMGHWTGSTAEATRAKLYLPGLAVETLTLVVSCDFFSLSKVR